MLLKKRVAQYKLSDDVIFSFYVLLLWICRLSSVLFFLYFALSLLCILGNMLYLVWFDLI